MKSRYIAAMVILGWASASIVGAQESAAPAGGWHNDCSSLDGWRSNAEDPAMGAKVDIPEPSVLKVTQDGESTWGKATLFISNVDVEKYPELVVMANKVDLNSAFTIQIAPPDWSEFVTVIPRCSADGKRSGNLKRAMKSAKNAKAFGEPASFNLVIVIEGKGKATYFDDLSLQAKD